ncbi:hypothetical protein JG688_00016322 [Phytophthora aleatoria]|uniref:Uncharacterized protein n=1 Tax=Phytophthora aleatoria TaxID=2496075 RepID=A0A8J5ICK9_9STRA|nr:hypothetical protein JG688_00016322 [Phytophthora aleatoria]
MNVLALKFFSSIQSLQYQEATYTIDQLIAAGDRPSKATTSTALDHCFLTLQNIVETVIKHQGNSCLITESAEDGIKRVTVITNLRCGSS